MCYVSSYIVLLSHILCYLISYTMLLYLIYCSMLSHILLCNVISYTVLCHFIYCAMLSQILLYVISYIVLCYLIYCAMFSHIYTESIHIAARSEWILLVSSVLYHIVARYTGGIPSERHIQVRQSTRKQTIYTKKYKVKK